VNESSIDLADRLAVHSTDKRSPDMQSGLKIFRSLVCVLALGATVIACGDDDGSDENAQTGDASVSEGGGSGGRTAGSGGTSATAGRSGGGATAGRGSTPGTAGVPSTGGGGRGSGIGGSGTGTAGSGFDAGAKLSDAQIAAVVVAANSGEIQLGTIAVSRAQYSQVRDFAQEMITQHGAAQDRLTTLLQSLTITPIQNDTSTQLEQEAQRIGTMLQQAQVSEVDVAYVRSQVDLHTRVLALFDEVLLPSISELALRTDLTLARGDVQRHLTEAQALLTLVLTLPPPGTDDAGAEDAGI
jgi:putative membrane protein